MGVLVLTKVREQVHLNLYKACFVEKLENAECYEKLMFAICLAAC